MSRLTTSDSLQASVVIPAFNAERYLANAIESALVQSHCRLEVIVVDDGSSDQTADVARAFGSGIQYLRQPNKGVASARNAGARAASAPLLAMLDADDVWLPHKMATQLHRLTLNPLALAVGCGFELVDERLRILRSQPVSRATYEDLLLWKATGGLTGGSGIVVRRDVFERLGGYDESLSTSADWDLALRLLAHGPVTVVEEPLYLYRQHGSNMHRSMAAMEQDMVRLLRKARDASPYARALYRPAMSRTFFVLAGSYWHAGETAQAVRCGLRALLYRPVAAGPLIARGITSLARKR